MLRILVLDDEPLVGCLLQDYLADLGYETVGPAESVTDALQLIETSAVDGAVLDLSVAGDLSYPVAAALTARGVPLAFTTGHSNDVLIAQFCDTPILSKPFVFADVRTTLDRLFVTAASV